MKLQDHDGKIKPERGLEEKRSNENQEKRVGDKKKEKRGAWREYIK